MKIFARIFYALLIGSGIFYSCETVAPETVDPSLVNADRVVDEFVNLQTETQDILNIVADVLIRKRDTITKVTSEASFTFDDCGANLVIKKIGTDTIQTTIQFTDASCNAAITQKVRQGTITVIQTDNLGYLDTGHKMTISFDGFQLNTRTISGTITVKNVSKSAFTETDTVKQELNYTDIALQDNGTTYQLTSGYQERGLISGLLSRSIGDDIYWADSTNYSIMGSDGEKYTLTHNTTTNSSLTFNYICWQNQIFFPNQGDIQIILSGSKSGDFTADVDFGSGACDPFKTITLQ
ncbi:hypothetical protein BKI52_20695 [marine bacterium AO1-C]|nr:hypothetical protein BKI52_20695 [marine bacterium AO1-C]